MWGEDAGIEIKFVQKLENYHNEKKDYQEKSKRVSCGACASAHESFSRMTCQLSTN
jgi:hypothetical protein